MFIKPSFTDSPPAPAWSITHLTTVRGWVKRISTLPLNCPEDHLSERLVMVPFNIPSIPSPPSVLGKVLSITVAPGTIFSASGFGRLVSLTVMPQSKVVVAASERTPFLPTATTFSS